MRTVLCPLCAKVFQEIVPNDHICNSGKASAVYYRDKETEQVLRGIERPQGLLGAAIDLNVYNLCWIYGADGASYLVHNLHDNLSSLPIKKRSRVAQCYFRSINNFLKKRYDYLYIGNWMPTEKQNRKNLIEQFRAILNLENKLYILCEKNTTKKCHICGEMNSRKTLQDKRVFSCSGCNNDIYRDENAAINLLKMFTPRVSQYPKARFVIRMFRDKGKQTGCDVSYKSVHLK